MIGNSEKIPKVLFELSNPERASILFTLKEKKLKMHEISKNLEMTNTETFRHLQRLSAANLIAKQTDGSYAITATGNLTISFLRNLNFVIENQQYFQKHDTSCLPYELIERLGELSAAKFIGETLASLNQIREIVCNAEEYILAIAEQVDSSHVQPTNEKVVKGMKFKFLMQKDLAKVIAQKWVTPEVERFKERRYLDRIPISAVINEREAFVAFRGLDGQIDWSGFYCNDKSSLKWCKDLFDYQWVGAKRWYPGVQIE